MNDSFCKQNQLQPSLNSSFNFYIVNEKKNTYSTESERSESGYIVRNLNYFIRVYDEEYRRKKNIPNIPSYSFCKLKQATSMHVWNFNKF